jgi:hypothetical protein
MVTPNRVSLRFASGSGSSAGGAFCIINTRSSFHDESMSCGLRWGTVQGRWVLEVAAPMCWVYVVSAGRGRLNTWDGYYGRKTQGGREGMRLGQRTRAVEPKEKRIMRCMYVVVDWTQGHSLAWEEGPLLQGRDSVGAACRA